MYRKIYVVLMGPLGKSPGEGPMKFIGMCHWLLQTLTLSLNSIWYNFDALSMFDTVGKE